MIRVKYRCDKCGHSEPYTKLERAENIIASATITLLALLGITAVIVVSITGVNPLSTAILQSTYTKVNAAEDAQLRSIAVNATRSCDGDYSDCYAQRIYDHIVYNPPYARYVPDSTNGNHTYDPLTVLTNGGDCKSLANSYVALLQSVGIQSSVISNLQLRHAVAIVPRTLGEHKLPGYYVVDLTIPAAFLLPDNETAWNYLNYQPLRW